MTPMRNLGAVIAAAAEGGSRLRIRRGVIGRIQNEAGQDRLYWVNERPMPLVSTGESDNLSIGVEVFYLDDGETVVCLGGIVKD